MDQYIKELNSLTESKLSEAIFKWGKYILMYGSFFFPFFYFFSHDTRMFGSFSFALLIIIMVVRPVSDIFPKVLLFQKILSVRRALGIAMGMSALTHGLGSYYYSLGHTWDFLINPKMPYLYGFIATIFASLLLFTSNNFSTNLLGPKWKWLHRSVHVIFYLVCIHIAFVGGRGIDFQPLF